MPVINARSPFILESDYSDLKSEFSALKERVMGIENGSRELKPAIPKFAQKEVIPDKTSKRGENDNGNVAHDTNYVEAIRLMRESLGKAETLQN